MLKGRSGNGGGERCKIRQGAVQKLAGSEEMPEGSIEKPKRSSAYTGREQSRYRWGVVEMLKGSIAYTKGEQWKWRWEQPRYELRVTRREGIQVGRNSHIQVASKQPRKSGVRLLSVSGLETLQMLEDL